MDASPRLLGPCLPYGASGNSSPGHPAATFAQASPSGSRSASSASNRKRSTSVVTVRAGNSSTRPERRTIAWGSFSVRRAWWAAFSQVGRAGLGTKVRPEQLDHLIAHKPAAIGKGKQRHELPRPASRPIALSDLPVRDRDPETTEQLDANVVQLSAHDLQSSRTCARHYAREPRNCPASSTLSTREEQLDQRRRIAPHRAEAHVGPPQTTAQQDEEERRRTLLLFDDLETSQTPPPRPDMGRSLAAGGVVRTGPSRAFRNPCNQVFPSPTLRRVPMQTAGTGRALGLLSFVPSGRLVGVGRDDRIQAWLSRKSCGWATSAGKGDDFSTGVAWCRPAAAVRRPRERGGGA